MLPIPANTMIAIHHGNIEMELLSDGVCCHRDPYCRCGARHSRVFICSPVGLRSAAGEDVSHLDFYVCVPKGRQLIGLFVQADRSLD